MKFSILGSLMSLRFLSMHSKKTIFKKSFSPLYQPKNENQQKYIENMHNPKIKIMLGVGPAGTGKTLFACSHAIQELKQGNIHKIILTRPVVSVEEEIGFLPGNLISKMDPWTRPLFDIFLEYYSKSELDMMIKSNIIEISPLAFMRGRTFKHSFIIADEMQNSSPNQMFMLATRIGIETKLVITGDLNQSDKGKENGLFDFMNKIKNQNSTLENIGFVEFQHSDIERSPIVRTVMQLYNKQPEPPISYKDLPIHISMVLGIDSKNISRLTDTLDTDILYKDSISPEIVESKKTYDDAAIIPRSLFFSKHIK